MTGYRVNPNEAKNSKMVSEMTVFFFKIPPKYARTVACADYCLWYMAYSLYFGGRMTSPKSVFLNTLPPVYKKLN